MKKSLLLLSVVVLATGVRAETFTVDKDHAEIGFTARHLMISDVKGSFNAFQGTVDYDLAENTLVSLEGWIDATSIDTNSEKRDTHLKSVDFFNVGQYPKLAFKTTSVEKTGEGMFKVTGNLTVLGVDRVAVLPVRVAGPIDDPWGNKRIGLSCTTELNRRNLGIDHFPATMIGDEIQIDLNAEATFKPAASSEK